MGKREKKSKRTHESPLSEGITDSESEALAVERRLKKMESMGGTFVGTLGGGAGGGADFGNTTMNATFEGTLGKGASSRGKRPKTRDREKKSKKKRNSVAAGEGEAFVISCYESNAVPTSGCVSETETPRTKRSSQSSVGFTRTPPPNHTLSDSNSDRLASVGGLPPLAHSSRQHSDHRVPGTGQPPGSSSDSSKLPHINGRSTSNNNNSHQQSPQASIFHQPLTTDGIPLPEKGSSGPNIGRMDL